MFNVDMYNMYKILDMNLVFHIHIHFLIIHVYKLITVMYIHFIYSYQIPASSYLWYNNSKYIGPFTNKERNEEKNKKIC